MTQEQVIGLRNSQGQYDAMVESGRWSSEVYNQFVAMLLEHHDELIQALVEAHRDN